MSRRVVVTGAGGFVGSSVVARLGTAVTALTHEDVDLTDTDAVGALLRRGDVIVNAAGYADATDMSPLGERRFRASNVDAVRSLAQAAVTAEAAQLVHISSVAAMGRWEGSGITESLQRQPRTRYARSKRDAELLLEDFRHRLPVTILRPTSVFGEGRPLAVSLCRVVERRIVPLPAFGHCLVPFTYIGNVVEAVRLSIGNPSCFGRTFIVGDERSYPLRDIVMAFASALRTNPRFVGVPAWMARLGARAIGGRGGSAARIETLTTSVEYSIEAFQAATGYVPPYSLTGAAQRIAAWYVHADQRNRA